MDNSNKLTACLVIHNEEKVIERCLKSISKVTSNILVVHDGVCHDQSLNICGKYNCQIYVRRFVGEAEPHRSWIYSKVKTRWILQLDADEFLSDKLIKKIPNLIKKKDISCFEFVWPYWNGEKYLTKNWPWRRALFQKDKIKYLAIPHEEIRVDGPVIKVPLLLEHRPQSNSLSPQVLRRKWKKWLPVHAKYFLKSQNQFERFPKSNVIVPHYYFLKDHPLALSIPLGIFHFAGLYLLNKGYKAGINGFKACLYMGIYYFLLGITIWRLKSRNV